MAQLPPKVPNMVPNWADFPHQKMLSASPLENLGGNSTNHHHHHNNNINNPSWVDEFLDFSSAKRGCHRRSISDSIAFLEMPVLVEECRRSSITGGGGGSGGGGGGGGGGNEFDKFDDEQLIISMFTADDMINAAANSGGGPNNMSCSNPSSPSDHNSINDEEDNNNKQQNPLDLQMHHHLKSEPDQEVQSSCKSDHEPPFSSSAQDGTSDNSNEKIVDPKRIKRILANRQSAQRSRVRKLQYISELERSVTSLQAEVSVLSPRVAFLDHQRLALNVDNSVLRQRIAALAQDKIFKDAHQEALKREIERLRQIYYQQNLKKMESAAPPDPKSQPIPPPLPLAAATPAAAPAEKEQLVN